MNCSVKGSPGYRGRDHRFGFAWEHVPSCVMRKLHNKPMTDNLDAPGDRGLVNSASRTSFANLTLVQEDDLPELKRLFINRCDSLNDPYRALHLLADTCVRKRIYIAAPDLAQPEVLRILAKAAQILVVYSIWPGRSSYSVFVEDHFPAVSGNSISSGVKSQPGNLRNHQVDLFVSALRGILALPYPPGPGRLAFSAIPAYAAPAMKQALREAGYGEVWDEGCYRYWIRELPPETEGALSGGEGGSFSVRASEHSPGSDCETVSDDLKGFENSYVLDELRSEADACLVNSLWTYRSPYSLPLVRALVAHRHTACVRLQWNDARPTEAMRMTKLSTGCRTHETAHELASPSSSGIAPVTGTAGNDIETAGLANESMSTEFTSIQSDAVAWILQYPDGSIGMAHTVPPHRRRGLMRRCVRKMTERLLVGVHIGDRQGNGGSAVCCGGGSRLASNEVFAYIVEDNAASIALFEGLGFQRNAERFHWFGGEGGESAEGQ
ncbi:hypothetical protein VaNZ11_010976, partial [Volvox africanus]